MTAEGKRFLLAAAVFAIAFDLCVWMMSSCGDQPWAKLIDGGSCAEFWFNRYQTLLGGMAALAAAWMTVRTMHRQAETERADEAERRLTRYASALLDILDVHEKIRPLAPGAALADADVALRELNTAIDGEARQATLDNIMGPDKTMVAFFTNCCRFSAAEVVFGKPDRQHRNMVWPLYAALTDGIRQRQTKLLSGARVSDLYNFSTIDQGEVNRALIERRQPQLL